MAKWRPEGYGKREKVAPEDRPMSRLLTIATRDRDWTPPEVRSREHGTVQQSLISED